MTPVAFVLSLGYVDLDQSAISSARQSYRTCPFSPTCDSPSAFIPARLSSSARSSQVGDASAAQECTEER